MSGVNPFEGDGRMYFAIVNGEGQYSLWPEFADIPDGWSVGHGAATRSECLEYIERKWTDMRPASLIKTMASGGR